MAKALTDIKFNGKRIPAGTQLKRSDFPDDVWAGLEEAGAVEGDPKSEPEPQSEEPQASETGSSDQPAESTTTRAAEPAAPPAKEGK